MLARHALQTYWAIALGGLATGVAAAEPAEYRPAVYRRAAFDGKTLAGWTVEHDAEVEIVDGQLLLKSGLGWLRSHHPCRDFELRVEAQALKPTEYDAGIFFRAALDGKPFPQGYQANLQERREGEIIGIPGTRSEGLAKPAGEWNAYELRVVGTTASLKINGQPAYSVDGLKADVGYVGFQIEVPNGGQFLLRNIELTEIGFQPLFTGKDFAGWESGTDEALEDCWIIENEQLICTGAKGPWLRTLQQFDDFNLRLEYQVAAGGNSGVYVRVPKDGNHHINEMFPPPAGFEVQVLDDAAPEHAKLLPYQYSASVYDFAGADPRNSRPVGEWNTLEIDCRGGRVITRHNGLQTVEFSAEQSPEFAKRELQGYLGLQNHSTRVAFRHVRIGPPQ